jgi:hypothetical protein
LISADWVGSNVTGGVVSATTRVLSVASVAGSVVVVSLVVAVAVVAVVAVVSLVAAVVVVSVAVQAAATMASARNRPRDFRVTLVSSGRYSTSRSVLNVGGRAACPWLQQCPVW